MKKQFDIYRPCFIIKDAIMNTTRKIDFKKHSLIKVNSTEYVVEHAQPRVIDLRK